MRNTLRHCLTLAAAAALVLGPAAGLVAQTQKAPAAPDAPGKSAVPEVPSTEHQRDVLKKVPEAAKGSTDPSTGAAGTTGAGASTGGQQGQGAQQSQQPETPKPKSN